MARKSRKNMMLQENTALPDKEKKVLFKAGLYARLSHEKEENIERGTIETQMELMKNYVKDHEDIVIEEEYYDASFTGTNFERPCKLTGRPAVRPNIFAPVGRTDS